MLLDAIFDPVFEIERFETVFDVFGSYPDADSEPIFDAEKPSRNDQRLRLKRCRDDLVAVESIVTEKGERTPPKEVTNDIVPVGERGEQVVVSSQELPGVALEGLAVSGYSAREVGARVPVHREV